MLSNIRSRLAKAWPGLWLLLGVLIGVGVGLPRDVAASDDPAYEYGAPYSVWDWNHQDDPPVYVANTPDALSDFLQAQWAATGSADNPQCRIRVSVRSPDGVQTESGWQDAQDALVIPKTPFSYLIFSSSSGSTNADGTTACPSSAYFYYIIRADFHAVASVPDPSNAGDSGCDSAANGEPMGVGDPVHVGTGALSERENDLAVNRWLSLTRYYNSQSTYDSNAPLGSRWRHNYQASLAYDGDSTVRVTRPCGKVFTFTSNAGKWSPYTAGVTDQLSELKDANGNRTGWQYQRDNDHGRETYDLNGQLTALIDASGFNTTLGYANGRLATVTDPFGRILSFSYDSNGRLSQVQRPDGQVVQYSYSGDLLSAVSYPGGAARAYHYDESTRSQSPQTGLLTRIDDENGGTYAVYSYNAQGFATSAGHAGGADQVTLEYGPLLSGTGSTKVTYATGLSTTLSYATTNGRMQFTGMDTPCGAVCGRQNAKQSFLNGLLSDTTDFNGNKTSYSFSSDGLLQSKTENLASNRSRETDYTWNKTLRLPTQRMVSQSASDAAYTFWTYNSRGQVTVYCEMDMIAGMMTACTPTSQPMMGMGQLRRWTYTYCDTVDSTACPLVGLLRTVTAPNNGTSNTTYSYYLATDESGCGSVGGACHRAGDLYQVTNAKGHVTTYVAYDKNGRIARVKDPNGVITDYAYTARGALQSQVVHTNADGSASAQDATTQFTYDPVGNLTKVTDADGVSLSYVYDDAHRLTGIVDALGNAIEYTLDAAGNKTAERITDANGTQHASLTRAFNPLGQLTKVMDGLNHTVFDASAPTSYDGNGNLLQSTDARGIQRQNSYDALNRLVQTLNDYQGTDASTQNAKMAYGYDLADRVTSITDPDGLNTVNTYDALGDLTKQTSPDSGATTLTYDAAGQVTKRTDANGIAATYTYDMLGRPLTVSYPDNTQNITYSYDEANSVTGCASSDPIGRVTRIVENAVTTVYCYDNQGRVTEKRQTQGASTDTTAYSYTPAGRLASLCTPSGITVNYQRDAAGRISTISGNDGTVVSNVTYLPFGPVASYTLGNGQTVTRTYDANYQFTDIVSPAFTLHVARDAVGDITAIGNAVGANPATETYAYDPLERLTTIRAADGSALTSLTYNKTGDRLSKTGSGLATGAYSYNPNTHQLIAAGNAARSVDADGNTTAVSEAGSTYSFSYNDRNRVAMVKLGDSPIATYAYNALNQRVQKTVNGTATRFVYDEASRLMGEYGEQSREYIWLGNVPVAVIDTSGSTRTVNYITADGLNTPRAISDSQGQTIWQWAYASNAWGEQAPTSNGYTFNLRFPGQYFDAETGLFYNVNRELDPATGRYTQVDPIGYAGGQWSLYGYVNNNPLDEIDPSGLLPPDLPPPISQPPPGRPIFNIPWYRPVLKRADDFLSDQIVKKATKGALTISENGELVASRVSFLFEILYSPPLGGCKDGKCADEYRPSPCE